MSSPSTFQNLRPSNLVGELLEYIGSELPNFLDSEELIEILSIKKNENQHSLALCTFLTNQCKARFNFQRENAQKSSSTVDIGVYKGANLIFTIEAKVLPTPTSSKRNDHEYVYGKGGGIERFKNEDHGLDNKGNLFKESGMIGYIKEQDFDLWFSKINNWISDASWPKSEHLVKISIGGTARFKSEHLRKGSSKVTLHHFWIYVN
ncbi:hypothetical protein JYB64_16225 [Algoriphagus aestuarii]|nr:hypothetical protein [Algoriphagus aestuarii]